MVYQDALIFISERQTDFVNEKTNSSTNRPYLSIFYSKKVNYVLIDTYSTYNFWYAFVVSQICILFEKPYIPILRGGELPNRLKSSPKFSKLIFCNSLYNVAPSTYLFNIFDNLNYPNLKLIPNTIEIGNYNFLKRNELAPKILWVRSLSVIYNPKMAIDVLNKIKEKSLYLYCFFGNNSLSKIVFTIVSL